MATRLQARCRFRAWPSVAHAVKGVEVSIDGGKTWKQARLVGPDMGKYAWRQFVLQAELPKGTYQLASRATDVKGNVQPETRGENQSGYNNTGWALQITQSP